MLNIFLVLTVLLCCAVLFGSSNLIDLEQAQRIAVWQDKYEKISYCFDLVKLYEGKIIPSADEINKPYVESIDIKARIKPYFNIKDISPDIFTKYKYKKLNGRKFKKPNQFIFEDFFQDTDGVIYAINQRQMNSTGANGNEVKFFMFVDINGLKKPNRVGKDIFIINIYDNHISPLGEGKINKKVKVSCSAIGNGLYCADHYLTGRHF